MEASTLFNSFCLIILILTFKCHCREMENFTMIYSVGKKVYQTKSGCQREKLTEFEGHVSSIVMHNDYLYISTRRSDEEKRDSTIWRIKKSSNSTSLEIDTSTKETFHVVNGADADVLSMAISNDYIYSGRSDGVVWNCSVHKSHSCENAKTFILLESFPSIGNIEYIPVENKIYTVLSFKGPNGSNWLHRMTSFTINKGENFYEEYSGIQGWATLNFAFGVLWIGDLGKVLRCPIASPNFEYCQVIHDFHKPVYLNIKSSKKYLCVRMESSEYIWICDPYESFNFKKIEIPDADRMGPFILV